MIEFLERFFGLEDTFVMEELMPETSIKKMKNGMFSTANIDIDRKPMIKQFFVTDFILIMRIDVTGIIPARTSPLRPCIGFTLSFLSVKGYIDPVFFFSKRRKSITGRLIIGPFRKNQR